MDNLTEQVMQPYATVGRPAIAGEPDDEPGGDDEHDDDDDDDDDGGDGDPPAGPFLDRELDDGS